MIGRKSILQYKFWSFSFFIFFSFLEIFNAIHLLQNYLFSLTNPSFSKSELSFGIDIFQTLAPK